MIAALRDLERWGEEAIAALDEDAQAVYRRLVAAAKTEAATDLAKIRVLAADLEEGLGEAVQAAGPSVTAAVLAEANRFLAGLAPLLAEAAHDM